MSVPFIYINVLLENLGSRIVGELFKCIDK
jgi:hypothetical protein